MILNLPTPCLEKSVTDVRPPSATHWIQTSYPGAETWLFGAFDVLNSLAALLEGWDGHHSPGIAPEAINKSRHLLSSIRTGNLPKPSIFPVSGGGIGMQWQAGNRELQFSVYPDGEVVYLTVVGDGEEEEARDGNLSANYHDEVKRLTNWLVGS